MSRVSVVRRACRCLSVIGAFAASLAHGACDPQENPEETSLGEALEEHVASKDLGEPMPVDHESIEPDRATSIGALAIDPGWNLQADTQASRQEALLFADAPTSAVSALQSEDLVFDYFEYTQSGSFPPHVSSTTSGGYVGYSREYTNGNILLKQGTYLYRRVGGSWIKGSFQQWYDWIKSNLIDTNATVWGVPFQSQLSASCSPKNFLCGYAGTNMLTSFLHGVSPTTAYMQKMAETAKGSKCPQVLSDNNDYLKAAKVVGNAPGSYIGFLSYDTIKMLVSEGIPLLVSLTYSDLSSYRCTTSWSGGHAVVVVGYSQTNGTWRIHDPLCQTSQTGAYRDIPSAQFRAAVTSAAFGDNTGAYALVVR